MASAQSFLSTLSRHLFWDCDVSLLDPHADRRMVLERVFSRGTESDERAVFGYYGRDAIKEAAPGIKYLDKKTLNYLSLILGIPKEDFKCCRRAQSSDPFGIC
jgi:hypothetical protein